MRLQALVESPTHVCCRYRLRAFEPILDIANHSLTYENYPRSFWDHLSFSSSTSHFDCTILQRKLPSLWELYLLRRSANRLIFDFDDAIWLRDSYTGKGFHSSKRLRRFRSLMARIDSFVAGNAYLADFGSQFSGTKPIRVIPTCVDVRRYSIAFQEGSPTLVWIGSSSTLQGLERIEPILDSLGKRLPFLKLKVICDRFPRFQNLPIIQSPWSEQTEASEIASAHIGISWIPDDPWSRGKCGLKVLQYMAAGLPVVANPVGVHPEMIRHEETGFLVSSESEWMEAIELLSKDRELRTKMGLAARKRVESLYSVEVGGRAWLKLLDVFQLNRASA